MATSQETIGDEQLPVADYDGRLGDGEDRETILETDGEQERCPYCGNWYERIGTHWSCGGCPHPPITEQKIGLLKGMMMGDGYLDTEGKYPSLRVRLTNRTFLQWFRQQCGWVVGDLRVCATATENAQKARHSFDANTQPEDALDIYGTQTISHPSLQQFSDWYDTGEILFPYNLSLSPPSLRMWYISDGGLDAYSSSKSRVSFTSRNESNRPVAIIDALEEHGFTVYKSCNTFRLPSDQSIDFFDLIGHDPAPGFEYKWAWQDNDRYRFLKEKCREVHCTQTLDPQDS